MAVVLTCGHAGYVRRLLTMNLLPILAVAAAGLPHLLITFLILLVVIIVIGGLIYAIEAWIIKAALPQGVRMAIGLILIIMVIIWAIMQFYPGAV